MVRALPLPCSIVLYPGQMKVLQSTQPHFSLGTIPIAQVHRALLPRRHSLAVKSFHVVDVDACQIVKYLILR